MFREKQNKWTRERGFLEVNGSDIVMLGVCLFFLALTVGGVCVFFLQPHIRGLSDLFSDPPARAIPPPDQKLHLAPGEVEVPIYPNRAAAPPPKK